MIYQNYLWEVKMVFKLLIVEDVSTVVETTMRATQQFAKQETQLVLNVMVVDIGLLAAQEFVDEAIPVLNPDIPDNKTFSANPAILFGRVITPLASPDLLILVFLLGANAFPDLAILVDLLEITGAKDGQ